MPLIDATFLYAAVQLRPVFYSKASGHLVSSENRASGFIVSAWGTDEAETWGRKSETGQDRYLVTNRHVLDPNFRQPRGWALGGLTIRGHHQPTDPEQLPTPQEVTLKQPDVMFPSGPVDLAFVRLDSTREAASAKFNALEPSALAGKEHFESGRITVGTPVLASGYPGIGGVSADRPILVGGVVASDPRYPAAIGELCKPGEVLCHSFSWSGMSGAPVLCRIPHPTVDWESLETNSFDQAFLAGVNVGHVDINGDTTAAGTLTRFIRSDIVVDLLRGAGAKGVWRT
ncbi:trypsin-like peptidase domain-containing protein [Streptomyces sp. NBC_00370]|uniref:trypsin-like peptidase domain-containing protein n=1 Tax=Streptomyces sp. NBC_00370 TaxID=2975728 RepID=UPI002E265D2D